MKWIILMLLLVGCSSMVTVVDYDDVYVKKHYRYGSNLNLDYYGGSSYYDYYMLNPRMYINDYDYYYYFPNNQNKTYYKRPDRGTLSNPPNRVKKSR